MSRRNLTLSLARPEEELHNTTRIYAPHTPPGPPPAAVELHNTRLVRRCTICRRVGHNRRSCATAANVPPLRICINCGGTDHDLIRCPGTPRQQLCNIIYTLLMFSYPDDSWTRDDICIAIFHTLMDTLTPTQIQEAILVPNTVFRQVTRIVHEMVNSRRQYIFPPNSDASRVILGRDHAKKITLICDNSCEEKSENQECFICCDKSCSLKASCGHEFCGDCVNNIIDTGKDNTSSPVCSFCRVPFTCLTTSEPSVHASLSEFIKNL